MRYIGGMTTIRRSVLLPYPAPGLFALVNDIEAYPGYMDGCVGAEILRREGNLVDARLDLSKGGVSRSLSTRNRSEGHHTIALELLEGPFDSFSGRWQFLALGDTACKVSLELEFKLDNRWLDAAVGKLFDSVTGNLVDSLARRAKELYG